MQRIEYRVKKVSRYVITRYEDNGNTGSVSEKGEYENSQVAYEVAYALCKMEHQNLGLAIDDERINYPSPLVESENSIKN